MATPYTVEVYKIDRRAKKGERLVAKCDYTEYDREHLELFYNRKWPNKDGYRYEIHETYVTVRNAMTGTMVQERYDLPYYMSVSSETYWSA